MHETSVKSHTSKGHWSGGGDAEKNSAPPAAAQPCLDRNERLLNEASQQVFD